MLPTRTEDLHLVHPKYRADIDGLRAVAVISVVIFHAFPSLLPGGFLGVDIFFVISGFLISSIILGSLQRGNFSFVEFYSRRIRRIFPALIVVFVSCFGLGWFVFSAEEYRQLGKHIFAGAIFLSNFAFLRESGYFDADAWSKPLLNLWSLGVEEQFYIFWPLFLYLTWKLRFSSLYLIAGIAVLSFAWNFALTANNSEAAFYLPTTRFWELLLGGLLAYFALRKIGISSILPRRLAQSIPRYALNSNVQSIVGAALIVLAVVVVNKQNAVSGWWGLLPTIGACLAISSGPDAWLNRNILSHKLVVWFGLISYPLYLWHWPLLSLLHIVEDDTPLLTVRIVAVLMSVALAWLTLQLVEKPIRFGGKGRVKTAILSALMVAVASLGLLTYISAGFPSRSELIAKLARAASGSELSSSEMNNTVSCGTYQHARGIPDCVYLASDTVPTVALVGDSHAAALFFGLSEHYKRIGENLVTLRACLLLADVKRFNNGRLECEYNNRALDYVSRTESIKTVILATRGAFNVEGNGFGTLGNEQFIKKLEMISRPDLKDNELILREALYKVIERFVKTGKKIIFVVDTPELGFQPLSCLVRPARSARYPCAVEKSVFDKRNARYLSSIKAVLLHFPTVQVFYPSQYLCDSEYCWAMRDGNLLYGDDDHLSVYGSLYIGDKFSLK